MTTSGSKFVEPEKLAMKERAWTAEEIVLVGTRVMSTADPTKAVVLPLAPVEFAFAELVGEGDFQSNSTFAATDRRKAAFKVNLRVPTFADAPVGAIAPAALAELRATALKQFTNMSATLRMLTGKLYDTYARTPAALLPKALEKWPALVSAAREHAYATLVRDGAVPGATAASLRDAYATGTDTALVARIEAATRAHMIASAQLPPDPANEVEYDQTTYTKRVPTPAGNYTPLSVPAKREVYAKNAKYLSTPNKELSVAGVTRDELPTSEANWACILKRMAANDYFRYDGPLTFIDMSTGEEFAPVYVAGSEARVAELTATLAALDKAKPVDYKAKAAVKRELAHLRSPVADVLAGYMVLGSLTLTPKFYTMEKKFGWRWGIYGKTIKVFMRIERPPRENEAATVAVGEVPAGLRLGTHKRAADDDVDGDAKRAHVDDDGDVDDDDDDAAAVEEAMY